MILLPSENFYMVTALKPAIVQERLAAEVMLQYGALTQNYIYTQNSGYFTGFAQNGVFEFKRSINYRNSFLPDIKGATESWADGSRVHVIMKLNVFVLVFMCSWLGAAAIGGIAMLVQDISAQKLVAADFMPIGMFLFGYGLMVGGFKYESNQAKGKLLECLEATVEAN